MSYEIVFLVLDECVALSVYGPIDLFHSANKIAKYGKTPQPDSVDIFTTKIVSLDGNPVKMAGGHILNVDGALKDINSPSVLVFAGLTTDDPQSLIYRVQEQAPDILNKLESLTSNTIIAASCTATLLIASAGLLDGKSATTTWWLEPIFQEYYPLVQLESDEVLVQSGNVVTSAAGASSLDLTLYLIHKLAGAHIARLCARLMVIDNARHSHWTSVVALHENNRDPFIEKADAWIRKQPLGECKVDNLAEALGVSSRTLLRRFQKALGESPQSYIQHIRMEQAKSQLESSDISIVDLAIKLGFSDENAFRRAFASFNGLSPSQYRKQFNRYHH